LAEGFRTFSHFSKVWPTSIGRTVESWDRRKTLKTRSGLHFKDERTAEDTEMTVGEMEHGLPFRDLAVENSNYDEFNLRERHSPTAIRQIDVID